MTTTDTRRERQLGWVTADIQRYKGEKAADWLDAINRQVCPFCGAGPFVVVAMHVQKMHGMSTHDLRDLLGIRVDESICDETHSHLRRRQAAERIRNGTVNLDAIRPLASAAPRRNTSRRRDASRRNGELLRLPPDVPVVVRGTKRQRMRAGPGPWCGTVGGYGNHYCRCAACTEAHRVHHLKYMQGNPEQQERNRRRQAARRVRSTASPACA